MSLGDRVPPVPEEWRARHVIRGDEEEVVTGPIKPVGTDEELLRQFGYDPDEIEIVGTINQWRKQLPDGEWRVSYYFKHRRRDASVNLPALYAAQRPAKRVLTPAPVERVTVPVLADVQAGKTGSRGGTPELIDRLAEKREKLATHLEKQQPTRTVLCEAGDIFEGFESGGNPMRTNDLSLTQQMDLAATEIYELVTLLAPHGPVDVMAVPSNHTAWRNGKQQLGIPGDDLGLFVHRQVERLAKASGLDATWHYPAPYDEALALEVLGTTIGLVHGNQYGPGGASLWWAKQQHGGQPVGRADILVTGHYHSLTVMPTGRNPYTGRAKWWLQAPTLDSGSDWYRNKAGEDSDPGLLVFDVTSDGFDLQSLTVL